MANTKISQLTANNNPSGGEELVYAYNNANGKMTLNTMKTFVENNLGLTYSKYNGTPTITGTSMKIGGGVLGYICQDDLSGSYTLDTYSNNTYIGMEHYIYIPSQTNNYTITANGVDNPFNITLPSSTNKACLMKFYCVSASTMIITDCKIAS